MAGQTMSFSITVIVNFYLHVTLINQIYICHSGDSDSGEFPPVKIPIYYLRAAIAVSTRGNSDWSLY